MCSDSDVAIFRDWLKKQRHLPQDADDSYIKNFIVASKGSLQAAKSKYEKFHMLRHILADNNAEWNPFDGSGFLDKVALVRLPRKSPEGYNIFFSRALNENKDVDDRHAIKWVTRFYYLILCGLWDNDLGDSQVIMVNDWTDMNFKNIKGVTPLFLKQFSDAIAGGLPLRIKAVYDIGVSPTFELILNTINTLVPKKQRERRFAYSKNEKLYSHLPQEYLPLEYGGKGPSLIELNEATKQTFKRHLDKLIALKAQVAAEAPFVPADLKPESHDTFKKLDID